MREVDYMNEVGMWSRVQLPDSAGDMEVSKGILVGPPPLTQLELPEAIEIRLNNQLYHRGLLTVEDLQGREQELMAAIQGALKIDVATLRACYE